MSVCEEPLAWTHFDIVEKEANKLRVDSAWIADVGLSAMQRAEATYDGSRPFRAYARAVVRNAILNHLRTFNEQRRVERIPRTFDQIEEIDVSKLELVRALLDDEEYELLMSYHGHDKSLSDIAREDDVARSTVWARLQKIHKKLRRKL